MSKYLQYICSSQSAFVEHEVSVELSDEEIKEVHIKFSSEGDKPKRGLIRITIWYQEPIDYDRAKELGDHKIQEIINSLVFVRGVQVGEPYLISENIKPQPLITNRMSIKFDVMYDLKQEQIDEFVGLIKTSQTSHIYYELYKQSMNHHDGLGKFMFLYSLLMVIIGAREQNDVDVHILLASPNELNNRRRSTKMNKNMVRSSKLETRFTWLRNQLGHTQVDSEIALVIKEINECLNDLDDIVKNTIKEKITR